jgi:hypothetical protein
VATAREKIHVVKRQGNRFAQSGDLCDAMNRKEVRHPMDVEGVVSGEET